MRTVFVSRKIGAQAPAVIPWRCGKKSSVTTSEVHRGVSPCILVVQSTSEPHRELRRNLPALHWIVFSAPRFDAVYGLHAAGRRHVAPRPEGTETLTPEYVVVIEQSRDIWWRLSRKRPVA